MRCPSHCFFIFAKRCRIAKPKLKAGEKMGLIVQKFGGTSVGSVEGNTEGL